MNFDDIRKVMKIAYPNSEENLQKFLEQLHVLGIDPPNLYQELEMSSDYVNTHRDTSYSNATISLHSHEYYEIIYCRTSVDVEYLIGSNRYRLQRGDIVCVPPGVSHRPILPEQMSEPYIRDVLWIGASFIDNIKSMSPKNKLHLEEIHAPLRTAGTRWENLGDLFRKGVLEETEKRPGWETAVLGNTLTLLTEFERAYNEQNVSVTRAEKPELLDLITAYIEDSYTSHITIRDLARQFYVSESTVSHLFKQKMGVSLYRYVTQRRLISAKNLIQQGKHLEDVSREVGFADYSTFYRAFKQEFGISPRQFGQL